MIGLDTNIIIRYLLNDDPVQSPIATRLIEKRLSVEGPGYVSLVAIAKTAWVLTTYYNFSAEDTARAIEIILSADVFMVQNDQEVFAAMTALKNGQASFSDALVAAVGTWAGCSSTFTFDRKASRLPGFELLA